MTSAPRFFHHPQLDCAAFRTTGDRMTERIPAPASGTRIDYRNGQIVVPDDPIIPFIEGDGTGADIWRATSYVIEGAVKKVYGGKRTIHWYELFAGDKAKEKFDNYLPDETVDKLRY